MNKANKRSEIIQAAMFLFLKNGYAATSMSAIAELIGGSKTTLWAYFASKEELFAAVIDMQVEIFSQEVDEVLTGQTFSLRALRGACLRSIGFLLRENSVLLYRLVMSEGERFPEIKKMFYERGPAKLQACLARFFATRFSEEDVRRLTQLTISALTGYRYEVLLRSSEANSAEHEAFVDTMLTYVTWPNAEQGLGR